jgi:hypothetical protein
MLANFHNWWLHGPKTHLLLVAGVFYWATGTHPTLALLLGLALAEFMIMAKERYLLRFLAAWLLLDRTLTGTPFWPK